MFSLWWKQLFPLSNAEITALFILSLWRNKTAEVNCLQRSTLSPTFAWMQLGMAHILCLLVSSYQSKLHFPCVYSALMHMCLSPLPSDGLDSTKYTAKKQTSLWRGLTWMEAYPLPLGYSRTKRDNLLWSSVTGELHMSLALIDKSKLVWWSSGCVFWQHNLWTSRTSLSELEVETATPWKDARSKMG